MAGVALRRQPDILAARRAFMARIAIHCGVRSGQRKSIVMLLDLSDRNLPALHGVALLAVGSHLPPVNVSVAILAALPHIREYRFRVTLRAGHRLVHAAQRILRVIMIELRNRADGPPPVGSVAVLAWNIQASVRTVRAAGLLCSRLR